MSGAEGNAGHHTSTHAIGRYRTTQRVTVFRTLDEIKTKAKTKPTIYELPIEASGVVRGIPNSEFRIPKLRWFKRFGNYFQRVQGSAAVEVVNLVPARSSGGHDGCLGVIPQSRQQFEIRDLDADIIMIFFEPERPRHAAAPGIQNGNISP